MVSGSPRATFIDCSAAPAVPLTRLSIAHKATTLPAFSSIATWTSAVLAPSVPRSWATALGQHVDEGLVRVGVDPGRAHGLGIRARQPAGAVTVARMPRDIGTEHRSEAEPPASAPAPTRSSEGSRDVAVRAPHGVGNGSAKALRGEKVGRELLARARIPHGKSGDHVRGVHDARRYARLQGQGDRGDVAAGHRDALAARKVSLKTRRRHELRHAVWPGACVIPAVVLSPGVGGGEAEVSAAVEHENVGRELGGDLTRGAVWQRRTTTSWPESVSTVVGSMTRKRAVPGEGGERRWFRRPKSAR